MDTIHRFSLSIASKFREFAALVVVAGLLVLTGAHTVSADPTVSITEAEAIEIAQREIGPIIGRTKLPELRKRLESMADVLGAAQAQAAIPNAVSSSEVHIIQSEQINAFVIVARHQGQSRSKNLVFLTTALLKRYLIEDARFTMEESLLHIGAIMAHEFGHSIDILEKGKGIEDHYGSPGNQAVELRADSEGNSFLIKAGFPRDALYKALKRLGLYSSSRGKNGVVVSMGSTHPETELRLFFRRLELTGRRLLQGQDPAETFEVSESEERAISKELGEFVVEGSKITYEIPKTLESAVERLNKLTVVNARKLTKDVAVEALALTLWIDQWIEDNSGRPATASERAARIKFVETLTYTISGEKKDQVQVRASEYLPDSAYRIERILTQRVPNHGLRDFRPHALRLEKIEILKAQAMREVLSKKLIFAQNRYLELSNNQQEFYSYLARLGFEIASMMFVAPVELCYEVWAKNPMDYGKQKNPDNDKTLYTIDRYKEAAVVFDTLSSEQSQYSVNGYRAAVLFDPIVNAALQLEREIIRESYHLPSGVLRKNKSFLLLALRRLLDSRDNVLFGRSDRAALVRFQNFARLFPERAQRFETRVRSFARDFWVHRGSYAFAEMSISSQPVNWNVVAKWAQVAGDKSVIYSQIRQGLKAFVSTYDETDYRKSLIARLQAYKLTKVSSDWAYGRVGMEKLDWFAPDVEQIFKGHSAEELAKMDSQSRARSSNAKLTLRQNYFNALLASNRQRLQKTFTDALLAEAEILSKAKPQSKWLYTDIELLNAAGFRRAFALDLLNDNQRSVLTGLFGNNMRWFYKSYIELLKKLELREEVRADILRKVFFSMQYDAYFESAPKNVLASRRFLRQQKNSQDWIFTVDAKEIAPLVYAESIRAKLVNDLPGFFKLLADEAGSTKDFEDYKYSEALNSLRPEFVSEIETALRTQTDADLFQTYTRYVNLLHNSRYNDSYTGARKDNVTDADKFMVPLRKILEKVQWSTKQNYQAFILMTNHKPSPETDAFFNEKIRPLLKEGTVDPTIIRILRQGRIYSEKLKAELAEPQARFKLDQRMAGRTDPRPTNDDLWHVSEALDEMLPGDSIQKDEILERLGWRIQIQSHLLRAYVEEVKSTNWRKQDARFVALASGVTSLLSDMSVTDKLSVLQAVIQHQPNSQIPQWLYERIFSSALQEIYRKQGKDRKENEANHAAREVAYATKGRLEKFLNSTTPMQRLPVIEIILAVRDFELLNRSNLYETIVETYLKFEPGSDDRIHLDSYLAIIEEHERALTLSYLLAHSQEQKETRTGSLKSVLEVFPPVGPKLGQRGRALGIFGPQYEEELNQLKDNVKPMSKAELEEAIQSWLDPNERSLKIELLEVKGSASIGTVVIARVHAKDGSSRDVALKVRRPHIARQIRTNMDLGRRYITEVSRRKGVKPSKVFYALIDAMESQFASEIDFREEAKKTEITRGILKSVIGDLSRNELGGWTVRTPEVLNSVIAAKDGLVAYEVVNGETFNGAVKKNLLTAEDRKVLGQIAVKVALKMLFQHGYFDPDRHIGNWMIDFKTKTFFLIDVGQLTDFKPSRNPFKWDARLTLVEFLNALQTGNADGLVRAALRMVDPSAPAIDAATQDRTRQKLDEWFKKHDEFLKNPMANMKTAVSDVIGIIYDQDFKIRPQFTFGALNGFLTLLGENFVTAAEFKDILASEAKAAAQRKTLAIAWDRMITPFKSTRPEIRGGQCELLFHSVR